MKPVMLIPPNVAGLPQLAAQMGYKVGSDKSYVGTVGVVATIRL